MCGRFKINQMIVFFFFSWVMAHWLIESVASLYRLSREQRRATNFRTVSFIYCKFLGSLVSAIVELKLCHCLIDDHILKKIVGDHPVVILIRSWNAAGLQMDHASVTFKKLMLTKYQPRPSHREKMETKVRVSCEVRLKRAGGHFHPTMSNGDLCRHPWLVISRNKMRPIL